MKAYSKDLRLKELDAVDRGTARSQSTRLLPSASGSARPRRWRSYAMLGLKVVAHHDGSLEITWWGVVVDYRAYIGEAEDHEQALAQVVRPLHSVLEGVVLLGVLGGLHPVQEVVAVPHIRFVEVLYALLLYLPRRHLVFPSRVLAWRQA
jgi:hypothetical protein